jgi:hypothetical protein
VTRAPEPDEVKLGPHTFKIYWSQTHWNRLTLEEDGLGRLVGRTHHPKCEIYIKPGMSLSQSRDTLLHEILHVLIGTGVGLNYRVAIAENADLEEAIVATVTPWLLGVLRDNPAVLAYLTDV